MKSKNLGNIKIENARIIFRNFSGKESTYNREGRRNFCVILDDHDLVKQLLDDGWNVRTRDPYEEGDNPMNYIQVTVAFGYLPPKIFTITRNVKTQLDEDSVHELDFAEIRNVDLTIRPYQWEVNGKSGVKAYLKTMYVTIEEDEFADKYSELEGPDEEHPFK